MRTENLRGDLSGVKILTLIARHRLLAFSFCALLHALCGFVDAEQQRANVPKIGFLFPSPGGRSTIIEGMQRELRAMGYVEGKKITFEYRYADNKIDQLPALADELVRLRVDALVVAGPPAALAAKKATRTIPIVFRNVADPVAIGLIDSMAHPGGNITGLTIITEVLAGKRLELLKETVPKLSRVAVLRDPRNVASTEDWKESLHPARELGLQLHSIEVSSADKFESAFKEAIKTRSAALAVTNSAINNSNPKRIADLAAKHRLPAISWREDFVASGGLMSYAADEAEQPKRVAYLIDKILKGAKPADLPVERPTKFEFIINLKAAKQIGLIIRRMC